MSLLEKLAADYKGTFPYSSPVDWFIKFVADYFRNQKIKEIKQNDNNFVVVFADGSEQVLFPGETYAIPVGMQTAQMPVLPVDLQTQAVPITDGLNFDRQQVVDYRQPGCVIDKRWPEYHVTSYQTDIFNH
jgi:hypothetical protein